MNNEANNGASNMNLKKNQIMVNGKVYTLSFSYNAAFIKDSDGNDLGKVIVTNRFNYKYWRVPGKKELFNRAIDAAFAMLKN